MDILELARLATRHFTELIGSVNEDQWHLPTPCRDWDVRALVNHVTGEVYWVAPLVEGRTIAEVDDKYAGDLLGDYPHGSFKTAAGEALVALSEPGAFERTVHLSFGDFSARDYAAQVASDLTVHAWDLAKAIGADIKLPVELVELALATFGPMAEGGRAAGVFGPAIAVVTDADPQTELLAITGRASD